jgi:hypothetical protein
LGSCRTEFTGSAKYQRQEKLDQLALDQLAHNVDGGEEDVEVQLPGAELGHRLVYVVERGQLDLAVVLLAEVLHDLRVEVGHPVVDLQRGALLGGRPLAIAWLSLKIGQVTGWLGLGNGMPPLVMGAEAPGLAPELEPHASSSAPRLPIMSPAPALCLRKPRLDSPPGGGVPSACQPSLGCIPVTSLADCPPAGSRRGPVQVLTERSVNYSYSCERTDTRPHR